MSLLPPATSRATLAMIASFVLAVVGLGITFTGTVAPEVYVKCIPALCLFIIGMLFALQRDADQRRRENDERHRIISGTIESMKATVSALHEAFKLPEHERILVRIAQLVVQAQQSHPFFNGIVRGQLTDLCGRLSPTAAGTYICEPDEEARLTNDVLSASTRGIKAVSYQDERWWNSPLGAAFIKLQRAARGLSIVRIFIVRSRADFTDAEWATEGLCEADLKRVDDLIKEDAERYTATYRIPLAEVPETYRRDFVTYDDTVLKSAEFIPGNIKKRAMFTRNESAVEKAIADFEILRRLATPVSTRGVGSPRRFLPSVRIWSRSKTSSGS